MYQRCYLLVLVVKDVRVDKVMMCLLPIYAWTTSEDGCWVGLVSGQDQVPNKWAEGVYLASRGDGSRLSKKFILSSPDEEAAGWL